MAIDASSALRTKLDAGLTLPASWYSDPAVLRLEQERIFKRSWQYVGTTTDVAEPGMYVTCRVGDVPVVVLRDKQGELRGFINVCRHRGHEVASGCGKRETLQCPYHAWTYDLDGSLRTAPRSDREPGFDASEWSLRPVLVETWGPLVFVNPSLEGGPLAETLGDLPQTVRERGLDPTTLEFRGRSREWIVNANWKLAVENYLECYHCPVAHKSFSRLIDVDPDEYSLSTSRWSSSQLGRVHHQVDEGTRANLPYVPEGPVRSSQFHFVWPNWTLNTFPGPENLRVLVFEPIDSEHTRTYVDGFWAPDTPDEVVDEITEFGTIVGQEDNDLVESVHRGLRSGMIEHGRLLLDSERLLQHFQLLVHEALGDPAATRSEPS
jgi:phenylpropionate dioxygenase-like ring-hydroxylating dioxygenase large terminal subunit